MAKKVYSIGPENRNLASRLVTASVISDNFSLSDTSSRPFWPPCPSAFEATASSEDRLPLFKSCASTGKLRTVWRKRMASRKTDRQTLLPPIFPEFRRLLSLRSAK